MCPGFAWTPGSPLFACFVTPLPSEFPLTLLGVGMNILWNSINLCVGSCRSLVLLVTNREGDQSQVVRFSEEMMTKL